MTTLPDIVNVDLHFTVYEPCTVTFDANGHGTAPAALENVPSATGQPTATAQPAAAQAPQTGDSSMRVWLGLAGVAACGLLALERLRRKG